MISDICQITGCFVQRLEISSPPARFDIVIQELGLASRRDGGTRPGDGGHGRWGGVPGGWGGGGGRQAIDLWVEDRQLRRGWRRAWDLSAANNWWFSQQITVQERGAIKPDFRPTQDAYLERW